MPRDLFGDVTRPSISVGNRKWYTVPLSLISHSAIVLAAVVIPLLATDVLPEPWEKIDGVIIPIAPPPPPPPRPPDPDVPPIPPPDADVAPIAAPDGFTPEKPIDSRWKDGSSRPDIVVGSPDPSLFVAPPPPPPQPVVQEPVRAGAGVKTPVKVRDVQPVYPAIAQAARVEGVVIIEATIGIDGRLINARVLRGVPLLDQAALDAVRQWEFTPSLLNGKPVPVIMTVTVQFKLTR
jgi:protein TonB